MENREGRIVWVPKYVRDERKGVDTPVPTQVVSNEELLPRPQHRLQQQVEALTMELGEQKAKKLGMKRRDFMRTAMGMATAWVAANKIYGNYWNVDDAETVEAQAVEEKFPKGEYFVVDVQAHFTNGYALNFRSSEFVKNMGFQLDNTPEAYSLRTFIKEFFFDSETSVVVLSGVPDREQNTDPEGKVLEGFARSRGVMPSWLMAQARHDINELAGGTQRAFNQGNCAPNHYWDRATNQPDYPALYEQMEREVKQYGITSWKWYCHTDPGRSGGGFQLDDEMSAKFYEKSRELGIRTFSVHKGYSAQSRTLGHLANPRDVEKAAIQNPDINFIIYHSAMKMSPYEPDFENLIEWDATTGDFLWHNVLMGVKERNPDLNNVYVEIGSAYGTLAVEHPVMCQHLIGKNIKLYGADHVIWGTDCLWWGSPQWVIDSFKRFQISDELCERHGYTKLTKEDKAKILGLNAAKIYNIDVDAQLQALPNDAMNHFQHRYREAGGQPSNRYPGWVRDDTRPTKRWTKA
jgi:uncharacterized protein